MLRELCGRVLTAAPGFPRLGSASASLGRRIVFSQGLHSTAVPRMPVVISNELPAFALLQKEGSWVIPSNAPPAGVKALPKLKIAMMNLMPLKEPTEAQLFRMLSGSAAVVEITLFVPNSYNSKNTAPEYMAKHYKRWSDIKDEQFDGFIITGAPIEHLPFEQVSYWPELTSFFDHVKKTDTALLSLCWGAMAALYHYYKVPKYSTPRKLFGVFPHRVLDPTNVLLQGLPPPVSTPVSRHTTWKRADIEPIGALQILLDSDETGPGLIWDAAHTHAHMQNHLEYDVGTLNSEYVRDLKNGTPTGEPIHIPNYYFPDNDPSKDPVHTWKPHGHAFYGNWLNAVLRRKISRL